MPFPDEEQPLPDFEIDQPTEFGQSFLNNRLEVEFYLNVLARRRSILTVYINEGHSFFPSSIAAVNESEGVFFLALAQAEVNPLALSARKITLVANLDRVKIQIRLSALTISDHHGQNVFCAAIPEFILRLQRREFFRLEPPLATPIHCKLALRQHDGSTKTWELPLADISGGGVSLIGCVEMEQDFPRDTLFQDCRLEIPGEGVIQVNLRVRKTVEVSTSNGLHSLRIGCEFVNLPGARLAFVEHYIARIERERKARDAELKP